MHHSDVNRWDVDDALQAKHSTSHSRASLKSALSARNNCALWFYSFSLLIGLIPVLVLQPQSGLFDTSLGEAGCLYLFEGCRCSLHCSTRPGTRRRPWGARCATPPSAVAPGSASRLKGGGCVHAGDLADVAHGSGLGSNMSKEHETLKSVSPQ